MIDSLDLQKKLQELQPGHGPKGQKELIGQLLQTDLPQFERDLRERQKDMEAMPPPPPGAPATVLRTFVIAQAILAGEQKYTEIRVPVLAIYAVPHNLGPGFKGDATARAAAEARDAVRTEAQAKAFESGVPSARVVRLPHANHFVFFSNEADVLREVNAFLGSLH